MATPMTAVVEMAAAMAAVLENSESDGGDGNSDGISHRDGDSNGSGDSGNNGIAVFLVPFLVD
jgi:hypothetical protein